MLIYEKEGKLNLNFQTGNDVSVLKENDVAKIMLGSTEVTSVKNSNPSNLNDSES